VPQLARARPVSRQLIQSFVNALLALSLVEYTVNPAHKRSKLVSSTDAGKAAFDELTVREHEIFAKTDLALSPDDIDAARRVLDVVLAMLRDTDWQALAEDRPRRKPAPKR